MPTYHYRCKSCNYEFEEMQKITEEPLKICPSCKKSSLVRIIGGGMGLVFKGSGFYITDYKNKSNSFSTKTSKPEKKTEPTHETKTKDSTKPSKSSDKKS